jgi:hypothetical protein
MNYCKLTASNANALQAHLQFAQSRHTKAKIAKELASRRTKDNVSDDTAWHDKKHKPLTKVLPKAGLDVVSFSSYFVNQLQLSGRRNSINH